MKKMLFALLILSLLMACAPATATPAPATQTPTPIPPSATATVLPPTATAAPTETASATATSAPTETFTPEPSATRAETISEMLQTHIVFYLILPEKGRTDACGSISIEPIISKRYRTGDKIQDVQIALNMLFSVGTQFYNAYYNALWNTNMSINAYTYDKETDSMTIDFGGYLPLNQLSRCDKHGIREEIWKTFYHYGIKEKTFTYYGKFIIDLLSRK